MSPHAKVFVGIATLATLGGLAVLTFTPKAPAWLAPYPSESHDDQNLTLYSIPGPPPTILPAAMAWAEGEGLSIEGGTGEDQVWIFDRSAHLRFIIEPGRTQVVRRGNAKPELTTTPDPNVTTVTHFRQSSLWARLLDRLIPSRTAP